MCGIFAAILGKSATAGQKLAVDVARSVHRGPDRSRLEYADGATQRLLFGFHRLAINGLTPDSDQPMQIGRCLLICNGEIYNTNELYKQMGIKQLTGSDCEIIAHLYLRHGLAKTVDMLEGVFAFVLYDQKTKQLHVARDLLGIRPLFIGSSEGTGIGGGNGDVTLAFASEAKSLLSLRGVCQFPPGTWWTGDLRTRSGGSGLEIAKHTSGIFRQDVRGARPVASGTAPNLDRLREVFHKAVRKRLILSERPVACLLSGGLDSTLVTAVLVREMRRIHGPSATVNTYSIGMKGSVDLKWAAVAAKHLRTKHHEICLAEKEFLDAVPDTVWHTESFDTTTIRASVGNFLVSRYIRDNSDDKVKYTNIALLLFIYINIYTSPNMMPNNKTGDLCGGRRGRVVCILPRFLQGPQPRRLFPGQPRHAVRHPSVRRAPLGPHHQWRRPRGSRALRRPGAADRGADHGCGRQNVFVRGRRQTGDESFLCISSSRRHTSFEKETD